MAPFGKQALQRLGLKLIGLAAKGIKRDLHINKSPVYIVTEIGPDCNNSGPAGIKILTKTLFGGCVL